MAVFLQSGPSQWTDNQVSGYLEQVATSTDITQFPTQFYDPDVGRELLREIEATVHLKEDPRIRELLRRAKINYQRIVDGSAPEAATSLPSQPLLKPSTCQPATLLKNAKIDCKLDPACCQISGVLHIVRENLEAPIVLAHQGQSLTSIHVNGKELSEAHYFVRPDHLLLPAASLPKQLDVEIKVQAEHYPDEERSTGKLHLDEQCNLFTSPGDGGLTTLIPFPGVLASAAPLDLTLQGSSEIFSDILCNVRKTEETVDANGIRCTKNRDYLLDPKGFSLLAGQVACVSDCYRTKTGKEVNVSFYVPMGQEEHTRFAHQVLQSILAENDYCGGSICLFNQPQLLTHPNSSTDADYAHVEQLLKERYGTEPPLLHEEELPELPFGIDELIAIITSGAPPHYRLAAAKRLKCSELGRLTMVIQHEGWVVPSRKVLNALFSVLNDESLSHEQRAEVLTLPDLTTFADQGGALDYDSAQLARVAVQRVIARDYQNELEGTLLQLPPQISYSPSAEQRGIRSLRLCVLSYLAALHDTDVVRQKILPLYENADNLTDRLAALRILLDERSEHAGPYLERFRVRYNQDPQAMAHWFRMQAESQHITAAKMRSLLKLQSSPQQLAELVSTFAQNKFAFHREDGSGYRLVGSRIQQLDQQHTLLARQLAHSFAEYPSLSEHQQEQMRPRIRLLLAWPRLSEPTRAVLENTLQVSQ